MLIRILYKYKRTGQQSSLKNETFNRKHFDIIMHAEPETKLSNLNLLCKIFKDNTLI